MQRIAREQARKYAFDWRDEPLLRVQPGESFELETFDASTGYFKTVEDKPGDASNAAPAGGTASSSAMDQAMSSSSAAM